MRRTRVVDCLLADLQAVSLDLTESVWRDWLMTGGRLGALTAPAAGRWGQVQGSASALRPSASAAGDVVGALTCTARVPW
jgi:phage terminase large subunit-like protein